MAFFKLMAKKSSDTDAPLTGSNTRPNVVFCAVSGLSATLPPLVVANWVWQSRIGSSVVGQRIGSVRPCRLTPVVVCVNRSARLGALKPLPTAPRSSSAGTGCQRRLSLGVVERPTPW